MRSTFTALIICTVLMAGACTDRGTDTLGTTDPVIATEGTRELTPEELGELGATIEKDPANVEALLAAKGLNEETFETAIRRVSEDPEASKRYAEAYKRARA